MRVAHVASEIAPWCGTGGLGEVLAALPAAQAHLGAEVAVFCPLHRWAVQEIARRGRVLASLGDVSVSLDGRSIRGQLMELPSAGRARLLLLDCPELFDREPPYDDASGRRYDDNPLRFAWLSQAVLAVSERVFGGLPDVLHAHDWQAALLPLFARTRPDLCPPEVATIFTIHNLIFQGVYPKHWFDRLPIPWELFHLDALEFWDQLSMLKAGVALADVVTTVSPRYAREITTLPFGCGLHDFLRQRPKRLVGVINGLDMEAWNPATDTAIPAQFSARRPEGKVACRQALLADLGLAAEPGEPLLAAVSRFDHGKGLDLVADIAPELRELGARLVVLGSGNAALEARFAHLAEQDSDHLALRVGWDPALARRIFAGADVFLMPSRTEPCGLAQMQAMRYGAVPVVHAVGGLADTVDDPGDEGLSVGKGTGFRFDWADLLGLRWALTRAIRLYRCDPGAWQRILRNGMTTNFGWEPSAGRYLQLYADAMRQRTAKA